MEELFHIKLSQTVSKIDVDAVLSGVKHLDVISDTECMATRSLDPAIVMVWVQLVSGTFAVVATGAVAGSLNREGAQRPKAHQGNPVDGPSAMPCTVDFGYNDQRDGCRL
jgi:hypothetical protein